MYDSDYISKAENLYHIPDTVIRICELIHPDDADGNSTCNPDMIRRLNDLLVHGEVQTDPRWDDLKKLTGYN